MGDRMVDDVEEFKKWMSEQPLCQWAAEKQRKIDSGEIVLKHDKKVMSAEEETAPKPSAEDEELMAALAKLA